ncbi:MAG: hypothetical protein Fur0023_12070 [Bacteroidia bacterium]
MFLYHLDKKSIAIFLLENVTGIFTITFNESKKVVYSFSKMCKMFLLILITNLIGFILTFFIGASFLFNKIFNKKDIFENTNFKDKFKIYMLYHKLKREKALGKNVFKVFPFLYILWIMFKKDILNLSKEMEALDSNQTICEQFQFKFHTTLSRMNNRTHAYDFIH